MFVKGVVLAPLHKEGRVSSDSRHCQQIRGTANEPGFSLLADPAVEDGFYESRPVLLDEMLDLSLAGVISPALASGPSTSAVGNPANCSSFAPYSMPVTSISSFSFPRSAGRQDAPPSLEEPVALGLVEIGQELWPDPDRSEKAFVFHWVGRNIVAHGAERPSPEPRLTNF